MPSADGGVPFGYQEIPISFDMMFNEFPICAQRISLTHCAVEHAPRQAASHCTEVQRWPDAFLSERDALSGGIADSKDMIGGGGSAAIGKVATVPAVGRQSQFNGGEIGQSFSQLRLAKATAKAGARMHANRE
jgi:hypothetical protein